MIGSVAVNVGDSPAVCGHTVVMARAVQTLVDGDRAASIEREHRMCFAAVMILGLLFWQWRPPRRWCGCVESPVPVWCLSIVSLAGYGIASVSSFMVNHFDLFGIPAGVVA